MVLAAGLGVRMRPLTVNTPKPLIEVAGKALIDHAFDRLRSAQVSLAVVNVHYLAEQIEGWARRQPAPPIVISDERHELLDTGGGIAKALPHLGSAAFFVINSDSFWIDGPTPALARLEAAWDEHKMDSLLLLCPKAAAIGYEGEGDFDVDAEGRLVRRPKDGSAPYIYAGCHLVSPRVFAGAPEGKYLHQHPVGPGGRDGPPPRSRSRRPLDPCRLARGNRARGEGAADQPCPCIEHRPE